MRGLLIILFLSMCSCSSLFVGYKEGDCSHGDKELGVCFAKAGYNLRALEGLKHYCQKQGKPIDIKKVKQAYRAQMVKECSDKKSIFMLAAKERMSRRIGHCTSEFTKDPKLEQLNKIGKEAGLYITVINSYKEEIPEAEQRRAEADRGFWSGLEDRLIKESPRELREKQMDYEKYLKKLLQDNKHLGVSRSDLNLDSRWPASRCSSTGRL